MSDADWALGALPAATLSALGESSARQSVILVGLDGSATSWRAFCWAAGQAQRSGARLIAVFVITDPAGTGLDGIADYHILESQQLVAQERASALRDEAERIANESRVPMRFLCRHGGIGRRLRETAMACGADLLVVGSSTRVTHRLAGSVGRRLAAWQEVPVVVVP